MVALLCPFCLVSRHWPGLLQAKGEFRVHTWASTCAPVAAGRHWSVVVRNMRRLAQSAQLLGRDRCHLPPCWQERPSVDPRQGLLSIKRTGHRRFLRSSCQSLRPDVQCPGIFDYLLSASLDQTHSSLTLLPSFIYLSWYLRTHANGRCGGWTVDSPVPEAHSDNPGVSCHRPSHVLDQEAPSDIAFAISHSPSPLATTSPSHTPS